MLLQLFKSNAPSEEEEEDEEEEEEKEREEEEETWIIFTDGILDKSNHNNVTIYSSLL